MTEQASHFFYKAYARVLLAVEALRNLPEHARVQYVDSLTREVKAASDAYRNAAALNRQLVLPPLLLHATSLMQSAWSNRDYNNVANIVAHSLPSLPTDPEALQWAAGDVDRDRWWDTLGLPPAAYYSAAPSISTPASSSSIGSMPPTPTQTYAPPPVVGYAPSSVHHHQQPLQMTTVPIPEAEFPPPRSSKRKDRDDSTLADNEDDGDDEDSHSSRMRGKSLVITDEMRSAGVNDPPCERCRDTRRSCVRGPHSACLTCVSGKTACSLVPPKSSNGTKKDGSSDAPTKRRIRANKPDFHVGVMQAPLLGSMSGLQPPAHPVPIVPGNAPVIHSQWPPGYMPMDPNQALVTRAELQAHEARMEARWRQIVQEEISAALARLSHHGGAHESHLQPSLQPQ